MRAKKRQLIKSFNLKEGQTLAGRYEVRSKLGDGWEGEVYLINERATGIERAAKLFFPHRNPKNQTAKRYALKLHKLRQASILIQYLSQEIIRHGDHQVTVLISEYVEGTILNDFIAQRRGKRLPSFEALHLLHALACGMADIHQAGEYHGDLHSDNIIVKRYGLNFEIKLIDLFVHPLPKRELIREDVCDLIRIFYDALGGSKWYSQHSPEIKAICCGLKRSLILQKYKTAAQLRDYLDSIEWEM
ncbi:MAG: protein kinase domain-containing protein [Gammaproteobacteria bacterium]